MPKTQKQSLADNLKTYDEIDIHKYESKYSFQKHEQKRIENFINNISRKLRRENAIDFGTGGGNLLKYLMEVFSNSIGADVSLKMALQNGHSPDNLIKCDCNNSPFKNESIDFITAYQLIHHLENPVSFFKEAHRILRKGGILYIDGEKNRKLMQYYVLFNLIRNKLIDSNTKYWSNYFKPRSDGEYHFGGFYKTDLKTALEKCGFRKVFINYRLSMNKKDIKDFFFQNSISNLIRNLKIDFLYTHLYIVAIK